MATTKQLLPIYDKPLIYYPLTTLMLAGIREVIVITSPREQFIFEKLLGNAPREFGMNIEFATQAHPSGLPEAFTIAEDHYGSQIGAFDKTALILGDNIFYGAGLSEMLEIEQWRKGEVASVFLQRVADPTRFGVPVFDQFGSIVDLEEKPKQPKSQLAVTGLYFFPQSVYEHNKDLTYSARGELEITDLLKKYLTRGQLNGNMMLRGMSWFDTGTPESLLEASYFVKTIQDHQGFLVGSPHEVAFRNGWINGEAITEYLSDWGHKTPYGRYLMEMVKNV